MVTCCAASEFAPSASVAMPPLAVVWFATSVLTPMAIVPAFSPLAVITEPLPIVIASPVISTVPLFFFG